jgi:nucleoside-diphosphate-sugar epimerase
MQKALVFGATGQLGSAAIEHLLQSGWQVTAITRSRPEHLPSTVIKIVAGDQSRAEILRNLGQTFDAVFEPTAYSDSDANDLLEASSLFGSIVVVSSCSVYADEQGRSLDEASINGFPEFSAPMTETVATVTPGPETYSTRKVAMENVFRESKVPITILRPCAIYGRNSTHPREWWLVKRALDGRKQIPIAYDGKSIFHTSSAKGIASLVEICMLNPAQRILNVADLKPLTVIQIAAVLQEATNLQINMQPFAGQPAGHIGSSPWSTPRPYVIDCTAAKALGWDGGEEYAIAVKDTARWLLTFESNSNWSEQFTSFANYPNDPFDYTAEDNWLLLNSRNQF